ncbi:hypothetical protein E2F48_16175 [Arthrobacter crusticola]|uniref:Uncharacterized protein n=1 Tax=Arthrobacter crusticola TaxID=2547960 RepID=A0A4R5TNH5_9MICC|nr:hypothetical protein [Arthrobacter crusticola]TDK23524.1 hypothetical protein E2F48_16175 [Arthrobacter crusticola]
MLNQPAEYFLRLHAEDQSRLLAKAEHRRNAARRRAGTADPLPGRPAPAGILRRVRLISALWLPARPGAVPQTTCP